MLVINGSIIELLCSVSVCSGGVDFVYVYLFVVRSNVMVVVWLVMGLMFYLVILV